MKKWLGVCIRSGGIGGVLMYIFAGEKVAMQQDGSVDVSAVCYARSRG